MLGFLREAAPAQIEMSLKERKVSRNIGKTYEGEKVKLDDNSYEDCVFVNCRLVYSGRGAVNLSGCRFTGSTFHFEDAAGNTVAFLNALAGDPGLRAALPYIIPNLERRGRVN